MRKQLLAIFMTLLLVVQVVAAETQSNGAGNSASLKRVDVAQAQGGVEVTIVSSTPVVPRTETLNGPPRLVVDLPNTSAGSVPRRTEIDRDGVKAVRVGTDGLTPPTTRVVIDLSEVRDYKVAADGNKLVLTLQSATEAVTPVQASAPAPVHVKSPFMTPATFMKLKNLTAKPAAAKAVSVENAAPKAAQPVAEAKLKAPVATPANDFVFVEPSYQAKDANAKVEDAKPATVAPAVRAIEAAAKFSDKPLDNFTQAPAAMLKASPKADEPKAEDPQATVGKSEPSANLAAEQKAQRAQQPAAVGPKYTGEPISVNLKDVDLKDFFRLVHEISGLNVVLDPQVKGSLTLVLDDVPWDQALDIVLKNNDLARQLEGNVLRVATVETLRKEAEARHAQLDAEALAVEKVTVTRFLSYSRSKDVVPTVKKFLSQRGDVISDDRTNALIIQDIPNVIPLVDRLLTQLDRKTQEVEIEARVVAATRNFARDIGTQLGFGWGNGTTAVGGASAAGGTPTLVGGLTPQYILMPGATTGGSAIPLFSNFGVPSPTSGLTFNTATNNIRIDAVLTMAESRGLLKILSRPRVVTQNNIQALVKQGVRVPIVTQAQLGGPPTVTYVDAFLRLTVTPQITSENTIFLNVDVENTTPDFGRSVNGNPTLITQQATTQVLVTDGGTVVIGGVIQTQNNLNIQQVPLLGNIPALGNLFKRRTVSTSNQELIFFITPRIIQT